MTRKLSYLILMSAALVAAASCNKSKEQMQEFCRQTDRIGLTVGGVTMMEYDENLHQLGWNSQKNEFRVSDDTMYDFFTLSLEKFPSEGGETPVTLVYTTEDNIVTKKMKMTLAKTDGQKYWFWSRKGGIGAVVTRL